MANTDSRVTIHMAASLDGFIARKDGSVDWLETSDEFAGGETMDPRFVETFLKTIDCYVMGLRTYETALSFEAKGLGWSYGDKPPSSSLVANCREPGTLSSSTQAISRSS
jgi:dihydrofolate reductase